MNPLPNLTFVFLHWLYGEVKNRVGSGQNGHTACMGYILKAKHGGSFIILWQREISIENSNAIRCLPSKFIVLLLCSMSET